MTTVDEIQALSELVIKHRNAGHNYAVIRAAKDLGISQAKAYKILPPELKRSMSSYTRTNTRVKFREYPETHRVGQVSVESHPDFSDPVDLGIRIASDGRIWLCVNGESWIQFEPQGG